MNISWLLCAIFLALALYVCYIKIYASKIENMSDLELILKEIQHQRKRKKKLKKKGKKKKKKKKIAQIRALQEEYNRLKKQLADAITRFKTTLDLIKTTTKSMNEVKDEQYNTRIRTSQNVGLLKEYTQQYDILS